MLRTALHRWSTLALGVRLAIVLALLGPCVVMWWLAIDYRIWIVPVLLAFVLLFFLPRRQRIRHDRPARIARIVFLLVLRTFCLFAISAFVFTISAGGPDEQQVTPQVLTVRPAPREMPTLKVLTLNLAHGRANGFHQAMQSKSAIRQNLLNVAAMLRREAPTIVALQEADGPSVWSGSFDHVGYLAAEASFESFARAEHVRAWRMSYGTAMLSQLELEHAESHTFDPLPPLMPKGFLVTTINWPGKNVQVDVVSVHLDFSLTANRRRQVRQMITELSPRKRPLVIMGDFNCDFGGRRSPLLDLMAGLQLKVYDQQATNMPTFDLTGKRIDWVLISPELEFVNYATLNDELSDHRAVMAELRLADD